jgi:hypothetical protein
VKFTIVPLVKKMCEQSLRAEDSVMVKISEQFGKLCLGLESEYYVFCTDMLKPEFTRLRTLTDGYAFISWLNFEKTITLVFLQMGKSFVHVLAGITSSKYTDWQYGNQNEFIFFMSNKRMLLECVPYFTVYKKLLFSLEILSKISVHFWWFSRFYHKIFHQSSGCFL